MNIKASKMTTYKDFGEDRFREDQYRATDTVRITRVERVSFNRQSNWPVDLLKRLEMKYYQLFPPPDFGIIWQVLPIHIPVYIIDANRSGPNVVPGLKAILCAQL